MGVGASRPLMGGLYCEWQRLRVTSSVQRFLSSLTMMASSLAKSHTKLQHLCQNENQEGGELAPITSTHGAVTGRFPIKRVFLENVSWTSLRFFDDVLPSTQEACYVLKSFKMNKKMFRITASQRFQWLMHDICI